MTAREKAEEIVQGFIGYQDANHLSWYQMNQHMIGIVEQALVAYGQQRFEAGLNDANKAMAEKDALLFGTSFMQDDKRISPHEIYKSQEDLLADAKASGRREMKEQLQPYTVHHENCSVFTNDSCSCRLDEILMDIPKTQ